MVILKMYDPKMGAAIVAPIIFSLSLNENHYRENGNLIQPSATMR